MFSPVFFCFLLCFYILSFSFVFLSLNSSYNEHTAALTSTESHSLKSQFNSTLIHDYSLKVNTSEFSDVKFLINGQIIYAHKIILAARSLHFNAMFSSGMREAFANEIEIPNVRYIFCFFCFFLVFFDFLFCQPRR